MAHRNERVMVGGRDLSIAFGLMLIDGTELSPPEPKTYTVDIPGGDGVIDLTEALTGDVAFERRSQEFAFGIVGPEDWERTKTEVSNFLHGRYLEYSLSWDPGYVYRGRFSIKEYTQHGLTGTRYGQITIEVDADPYKSKGTQAYRLNATGGRLYRLESGRRKVRPTIECEQPCFVTWEGEEIAVPAGTWRLNDVAFSQGVNEIWVNTRKFYDVTWDEVSEGGQFAQTWGGMAGMRWDEVQMLGQSTADVVRAWEDLALVRWADMAEGGSDPKHWYDLNYTKNAVGDSTAYLTYEWEDL